MARQIETKLALGEYSFEPEKPPATFKTCADSWVKTTVPATCKRSTLRDYTDILNNHLYPVFSNTVIGEMNRGMIKDFLMTKINDGYSKSTVSHLRDVISGVMNKAMDGEIILANPSLRLGKYLNSNKKKKQIEPLTGDELTTLLKAVAKQCSGHYPLFLLLARTGMRIGEALALQWKDIHFKDRYIEVERSFSRSRISTPKSGKTRRVGYLRNGNPPCDIRSLPKCQATAKSTGKQCGNIAMKGKKVCYLHGGKSTGAPLGNMHALKHENFTAQAKLNRKYVSNIIRESRKLISENKERN